MTIKNGNTVGNTLLHILYDIIQFIQERYISKGMILNNHWSVTDFVTAELWDIDGGRMWRGRAYVINSVVICSWKNM